MQQKRVVEVTEPEEVLLHRDLSCPDPDLNAHLPGEYGIWVMDIERETEGREWKIHDCLWGGLHR